MKQMFKNLEYLKWYRDLTKSGLSAKYLNLIAAVKDEYIVGVAIGDTNFALKGGEDKERLAEFLLTCVLDKRRKPFDGDVSNKAIEINLIKIFIDKCVNEIELGETAETTEPTGSVVAAEEPTSPIQESSSDHQEQKQEHEQKAEQKAEVAQQKPQSVSQGASENISSVPKQTEELRGSQSSSS